MVLERPQVADHALARRQIEVERVCLDRDFCSSCPQTRWRSLVGARAQNRSSLETARHRSRLPPSSRGNQLSRLATSFTISFSRSCSGAPIGFDISKTGSRSFPVGRRRKPFATPISVTNPAGFSIAITITGRGCHQSASTSATAAAAAKHLWRTSQPVGL